MLSSRWMHAYIRLRRGEVAEAAEEVTATRALLSDTAPPIRLGEVGYMLALVGRTDDARVVLRGLRRRSQKEFVPSTALALVHIGLGEHEQALDELDRGLGQRDTFLAWLKVLPIFDPIRSPIRSELRFQRLLQHMRFPD